MNFQIDTNDERCNKKTHSEHCSWHDEYIRSSDSNSYLRESNSELQYAYKHRGRMIERQQQQAADKNKKIEELQKQLAAMTQERDKAIASCAKWQVTYEEEMESYRKQVEQLQSDRDRLAAELAELKTAKADAVQKAREAFAAVLDSGFYSETAKTIRGQGESLFSRAFNAIIPFIHPQPAEQMAKVVWDDHAICPGANVGDYELTCLAVSANETKWKVLLDKNTLAKGSKMSMTAAKLAAESALRELIQPTVKESLTVQPHESATYTHPTQPAAPAATPSDKPRFRPFDEIHEEYRNKLMQKAATPSEPSVEYYIDRDYGDLWKGPIKSTDNLHYAKLSGVCEVDCSLIWVLYASARDPKWIPASHEIVEQTFQNAWKSFYTTQLAERDKQIAELTPLAEAMKAIDKNKIDITWLVPIYEDVSKRMYARIGTQTYYADSALEAIAAARAGREQQ